MRNISSLLLLLIPSLLTAKVELFLRDGTFSNNIVRTDSGGVIEDERIRIQADHLIYERTSGKESVSAKGNLLVLFDKRILTGCSLTYNFSEKKGVLEGPLLSSNGWIITGERLLIQSDGSLVIEKGDVAPLTNIPLSVGFERIRLQHGSHLHARRVSVRLFKKELFTWPSLRTTLDAFTDIPLQFRVSFGGYENTRASVSYRLIKTDVFKATASLNAVISRGPGAGLDTNYKSLDKMRRFDTKSFVIYDRSWDDPNTFVRYRLQGVLDERRLQDRLKIHMTYDWLSDSEMAFNYSGKDFQLPTAQRTEASLHYQENCWITDFAIRTRINTFQTINQELPYLQMSFRPFQLGWSGIICDNRLKAGYLSYIFATGTPSTNFASSRVEWQNRLYRPLQFRPFIVTPETGFNAISYSNGPHGGNQEQVVAFLGLNGSAPFFQTNRFCFHSFEPYLVYRFFSQATAPFGDTYIFSIDDGYSHLNMLRLGFRQSLFLKTLPFVHQPLFLDLWTNAFFDEHTLQKNVPRIFGSLNWKPVTFLNATVDAAWNRETNSMDYTNIALGWTINHNLALKMAFLQRGPRAWRKANYDNFMLDMQQTEETLLHSILSDRRNTFLTHIFWRFHPDWTGELQTRTGWNRINEPSYYEYKIGFTTVVDSYWRVGMSFERRTTEKRFAFSFRMIH